MFRYYILDLYKDKTFAGNFPEHASKLIAASPALPDPKLIPRFTYTNTSKAGSCPEKFICPPYGDAPKELYLDACCAIERCCLLENADVIACVQMGFVRCLERTILHRSFSAMHRVTVQQVSSWIKTGQTGWKFLQALLNAVPDEQDGAGSISSH